MNFPQEHSNHPESNTEWWYFAGMGDLDRVGRVNYHVCFFRKFSSTHKKQVYFAHQGLNINGEFEFKETRNEDIFNYDHMSRCADKSLYFTIGDWNLQRFRSRFLVKLGSGMSLTHTVKKRPAIHGEGYYSITNMAVQGAINGSSFNGNGWFDHEFADFPFKQIALMNYHWFALQLDSEIEIMLYVWPREPTKSFGTTVFPQGDIQSIKPGEYCVASTNTGWKFELPKYGLVVNLNKATEEKIRPQLGPPYTEGTFDIVSRGRIGQGFFEIVGE